VTVCSFQGGDVSLANWTGTAKLTLSPTKALTTKLLDQQVGYQTSVSTVSIGKWMYKHQPVMEPNSHFIPLIRLVF
jgi:hypothetical protein